MEHAIYKTSSRSLTERAADLLRRMTLEEKLAQLGGVWGSAVVTDGRFDETKAAAVLANGTGHISRLASSGTLLPRQIAEVANGVQRFLLERTRLGIPAIVHEESCAGFMARTATQFPQAIGLASTWNASLIEEMGRVIRAQMLAVGARQTLAPVLDVARDARWGRCEETFGEDPYLIGRIGVAYVRGVQGDDLRRGVAATAKHFLGYGAPEGGLNWAPCQLPQREILERILPPFAAAVREARIAAVMNGYEEIDGVPCAASEWLLTRVLRDRLGFEGTVVADYYAVICLQSYHQIAADKAEAARRALAAGLDVELPELDCFGTALEEAVESGRVDAGLVDRAVERALRQKLALGLFEQPFVDADRATEVFDTPPQRELARRIARQSIVLLKNDGDHLPLDPYAGTIAVIGPNADTARGLQGDYHYPTHLEIFLGAIREGDLAPRPQEGTAGAAGVSSLADCFPPTVTILEGIRRAVSSATDVRYARGCDVLDAFEDGFAAAIEAARGADVAIVVAGERSGLVEGCTSGEAIDRADVRLPGAQERLIEAVVATGTPTVVVLINGRPLALADVASRVPALVEAWLPGEEGGTAVADVLFGLVAPSGKLPITLPRSSGQLPLYYNHKPSGARSQFHGAYADSPTTPLFPFGHGLSYTRFEYSGLRVAPRKPRPLDLIEISFDVTNAGERAAEEVAQLYLHDVVASLTRPVKELKGFARVALEPGETRHVEMRLDLRQLAFYDAEMKYVVEPGDVEVLVGASSEDIRLHETITVTGDVTEIDPAGVVPTAVTVGPARRVG